MSLAVTPSGSLPFTVTRMFLECWAQQGLGRQHMLDFRGADAEGQRAESAMGGGVAVAADDGGARQGPALFRPDDMHDALADIVHREIFDAEILGVLFQGLDLQRGFPAR